MLGAPLTGGKRPRIVLYVGLFIYVYVCEPSGKEMFKETSVQKEWKEEKRTSQACSRVLYQTRREVEKYREVSRGVYCTSPTCLEGTKVAEPAVGLPNVVV